MVNKSIDRQPDTPLFRVIECIGTDPQTGLDITVHTDEDGSHLEAEPSATSPVGPLAFIIVEAI